MQVRIISSIAEMDAVKGVWEAAYLADGDAPICVAWAWLRGWLEATPHQWFILAASPASSASDVAFLPLAASGRRLMMAGNPIADYTGFVCPPEYADAALNAFAGYIQKNLRWDCFELRNLMDNRLDSFLAYFEKARYTLRRDKLNPCPYIQLPGDWETYLKECLGPRTSRDVRRSLKKIEGAKELRLTRATRSDLDTHLDVLLSAWQARWEWPPYYREGFEKVMRTCFENDLLWLSILWDGPKPISSLAGFLDQNKKAFTACLTASDLSYSQLRPGKALYAISIREAIENGCTIYDFTQGNEDYKYSLGAKDRQSPSVTVSRKGLRMVLRNVKAHLKSLPVVGSLLPGKGQSISGERQGVA